MNILNKDARTGYFQLTRYLLESFRGADREIQLSQRERLIDFSVDLDNIITKYELNPVYKDHRKQILLIKEVLYEKLLGKPFPEEILPMKDVSTLYPGDMLVFDKTINGLEYTFMVCVQSTDNMSPHSLEGIVTYPNIPNDYKVKSANYVIRPTFDPDGEWKETLAALEAKLGAVDYSIVDAPVPKTINVTNPDEFPGFLQIGDIKFLVSPTQMSFVTQNGYQYFPTIRTSGNPKIPSLQEVKSLHFSMIFPNQDSINNQLIPLFAMFKRTPFVNLKNKDITRFFKELINPGTDRLSIALESINIQSIPGFPNSLQADITFLPFDHRIIGSEFKAFKTFEDVQLFQEYTKDNSREQLEQKISNKLYETSERLPYVVPPKNFRTTHNFEESEPFRVFYQSLIKERNEVRDDMGNIVYKSYTGDVNSAANYRQPENERLWLKLFRPTKEENYLHEYSSENNKKPVIFKYKYITEDLRSFTARTSQERQRIMNRLSKQTVEFAKELATSQDIAIRKRLEIFDRDDFLDQATSFFQSQRNRVINLLKLSGVDVTGDGSERVQRVSSKLEFFIKYALSKNKLINDAVALNAAAEAARDNGLSISDPTYPEINLLDSIAGSDGEHWVSIGDLAQKIAESIYGDIEEDMRDPESEAAKAWADFFERFTSLDFQKTSILDVNSSDFRVHTMPFDEEVIVIDNRRDIITNWSLSFSNKFVPHNVNGFKYPYYQHLGSEDIQIQLGINSLQHGRDDALKEKLSELNDRLQIAAKVIMYHAPELMSELDPRLEIEVPTGHVFNVFGIKKVVYNGSNVSSVPGSPGLWNINLNLTQANFTVRDYQEISVIPNHSSIEEEIINLIPRLRQDDSGNIRVINYKMNLGRLKEEHDRFVQKKQAELDEISRQLSDPKEGRRVGTLPESLEDEYRLQQQKLESELEQVNSQYDAIKKQFTEFSTIGDPMESDLFGNITKGSSLSGQKLKDLNKLIMLLTMYERGSVDLVARKRAKEADNNEVDAVSGADRGQPTNAFERQVRKTDINDIDTTSDIRYTSMFLQYGEMFDKGIIEIVESSRETENIRTAIKNSGSNLAYILRHIIARYDYLVAAELNLIEGLFRRSDVDKFLRESLGKIGLEFGVMILLGVVGMLAGVVSFGVGSLLLFGAASWTAASMLTRHGGKVALEQMNKFKDMILKSLNGSIESLVVGMKRSYVGELSTQIIKDPPVRHAIFGDKFDELIEQSLGVRGSNCYNDFDIPNIFKKKTAPSLDSEYQMPFEFSPSFYLYDYDLSKLEKYQYVYDSFERFRNIGEISYQLAMRENYDTIVRLQSIKDVAFDGLDANIKSKILSDLAISTRRGIEDGVPLNKLDAGNTLTLLNSLLEDIQQIYTGMVIGTDNTEGFDSAESFDPDYNKMTLVMSARNKRVLDLLVLQAAVNFALSGYEDVRRVTAADAEEPETNPLTPFLEGLGLGTQQVDAVGSLKQLSYKTLLELSQAISSYFETGYTSLDHRSKEEFTKVYEAAADNVDKYKYLTKNAYFDPDADGISLPGSNKFEVMVYKHITDIITMTSAIQEYRETGRMNTASLQSVPEIAMLGWFNWRNVEDIKTKQIERLQTYLNAEKDNHKGRNGRLFPTFKIFFVEEDRGVVRDMDDYYSYDAIQSIQIVANKYSAGRTAILRLHNSTGNLTQPFSLMREEGNILEKIWKKDDNIFLGTLDIKPGTKMIIKMGYAANDRHLQTVFVGRIIEMNPGATLDLIAQSFGSQLNHDIVKMRFGFLSSAKEHGDVASAVLDSIPGIEGLGKPSNFGLGASASIRGKNVYKGLTNYMDKFMLSNVITRVDAGMFAADNPRDDNIFLPYHLSPIVEFQNIWGQGGIGSSLVDSIFDDLAGSKKRKERKALKQLSQMNAHDITKPTFDWVVYDQSAWQALQEISLYHRNTFPIVKMYNDDPYSTLNEIRETIVVGKKEGVYKNTDAFSLSTLQYGEVQDAVETWSNNIHALVSSFIKDYNELIIFRPEEDLERDKSKQYDFIKKWFVPYGEEQTGYINDGLYTPSSKLATILSYLSNRRNALTVSVALLRQFDFNTPLTLTDFSFEWIKQNSFSQFLDDKVKAVGNLMLMPKFGNQTPEEISKEVVLNINGPLEAGSLEAPLPNIKPLGRYDRFFKFIITFSTNEVLQAFQNISDLNADEFYNVNPLVEDNSTESLLSNPRYDKIQHHHLITDTSDILSNDIVLSSDFRNAVTVYYLPEPKFYSSLAGMEAKELDKIKSFTIKAFGDIDDNHVRVLETYQKNVDTNWWDIKNSAEEAFNFYTRTRNPVIGRLPPVWNALPSFVTVGLNLLQREVEKMYRGTIKIVGNPSINPMDILHIDDTMNDLSGTVEVEEVIHSFTPTEGFTTTITPCLITYDRNPITMNDVGIMKRIMETGEQKRINYRRGSLILGAISAGLLVSTLANIANGTAFSKLSNIFGTAITGLGGLAGTVSSLYEGTVGVEKRYTKFLYDQMANVFGRDCINFSTLFYHGSPYMAGFDGVDYTKLKTLINHQISGLPLIQRLAVSNDAEAKWIIKNGKFDDYGLFTAIGENTPLGDWFIDIFMRTREFGNNTSDFGRQ